MRRPPPPETEYNPFFGTTNQVGYTKEKGSKFGCGEAWISSFIV